MDLRIPILSGDRGHMHEIIDGRLGAIDPPFITMAGFAVPKDLQHATFFARSGAMFVGLEATAAGERPELLFEDEVGLHDAPFPVDDRNAHGKVGEEVFAEPLLEPLAGLLQATGRDRRLDGVFGHTSSFQGSPPATAEPHGSRRAKDPNLPAYSETGRVSRWFRRLPILGPMVSEIPRLDR